MIYERIKKIISEHLDIDTEGVTEATTFDELGIDSSELVDLAITVENEFNTNIPNRTLAKFRTVGDIVRFVERL